MQRKLFVAGRIVIPVYFPVHTPDREQALKQVQDTLNSRSIAVFSGDIETWNGKSYPILARRCRAEWTDVVSEDDVI